MAHNIQMILMVLLANCLKIANTSEGNPSQSHSKSDWFHYRNVESQLNAEDVPVPEYTGSIGLRQTLADEIAPLRHKSKVITTEKGFHHKVIEWIQPDGGYEAGVVYKLADAIEKLRNITSEKPFSELAKKIATKLVTIDYRKAIRTAEKDIDEDHRMSLFMGFLPFVVLMAVGLILAICVPLTSCLYCCCISICPCDCAKRRRILTYDEARNQSQCCGAVDGTVACVTIVVLLIFSGSMFGIAKQFPEKDPRIFVLTEAALDDLQTFFEVLTKNMEEIVTQDVKFATDVMTDLVDNMVYAVLDPIFVQLDPHLRAVREGLPVLNSSFEATELYLKYTKVALDDILLSFLSAITEMNQIITDTKSLASSDTECKSNLQSPAGQAICTGLPNQVNNIKSLPTVKQSAFSLRKIEQILEDVEKKNVSGLGMQGTKAHISMASTLNETTHDVQMTVLDILMGISRQIEPEIDDIHETIGKFSKNLEMFKNTLHGYQKHYLPVRNYTLLGLAGFAGVIFLLAMMFAFGLLLGMSNCSSDLPDHRSNAGDFGGRILKTSFNISFCYLVFFLFVGTIMMFFGVSLSVICNDAYKEFTVIQVLDDPDTFDGKSKLGEMMLNDSSIVLKMEDILMSCKKNNSAAYAVLKMHLRFNLEEVINIESKLPTKELTDTNVNDALDGISIYTTEDDQKLEDVITQSREKLGSLDLPSFETLIGEKLTTAQSSVEGVIQELNKIISQLEEQGLGSENEYRRKWQDLLTRTKTEDKNVADLYVKQKQDFQPNLHSLDETVNNMVNSVEQLKTALNGIEGFLAAGEVKGYMRQGLDSFIKQLRSLAESLLEHIKSTLRNDLAKCGLLWNVFDAVGVVTCNVFLLYLNTIWLGMIVVAYTLLIGMWSFSKLSRHFRIPDDMEDYVDRKYFDVRELPPKLGPLLPYMAYPEDWEIPHDPLSFQVRKDMNDDV